MNSIFTCKLYAGLLTIVLKLPISQFDYIRIHCKKRLLRIGLLPLLSIKAMLTTRK